MSASGGTPPFEYAVSDSTGEPPVLDSTPSSFVSDDLELDPTTGTTSGTPTFDEVWRTACTSLSTTLAFTITVTDAIGFTAHERYTLSIPGPMHAAPTPLEAHTICGIGAFNPPAGFQPAGAQPPSGSLFTAIPIDLIQRFGARPGFVTPIGILLTGTFGTPKAVEFGGIKVPFVFIPPSTITTVLPVGAKAAEGATVKTPAGTISITRWWLPATDG